MLDYSLFLAVLASIALLLLLILRLKLPTFLSLFTCEYSLGHLCGYSSAKYPKNPSRRNGRYLGLCRYSGGLRYFVGRDVGTFRWGTGIGSSDYCRLSVKDELLGRWCARALSWPYPFFSM